MTEPEPQAPRPPDRTRASRLWPVVALILGLALVFAGTALYLFHSLRQVPGEIAAGGERAVQEVRELARAFNQGTVTRRFLSYATTVEGTQRLQVATLQQTEVFGLEDRASTLWGALELPAVAVRATAPVETTYFVDLTDAWELSLEDHRVLVQAPTLRFNKPGIDASEIRYEVRQGSLIRDEKEILRRLKRELTGRSAIRARKNLPLVRDTARRQVEAFVRSWLLTTFGDAESYRVEVVFADEEPGGAPVLGPEMPPAEPSAPTPPPTEP